MKYKKSCFNFSYKRDINQNVIYNTFTKALVVMDDKEFKEYKCDLVNKDVKSELILNGILVEESFNEMDFLKYFHYKAKFSNENLYLTIAPTMDCNFSCPYCYENRRTGRMSREIQNEVIKYIDNKVQSGVKYLHLSWYGGEPMLCLDGIVYMSNEISEICNKYGCLLVMHMVTNGYLLTEDNIELLDKIGITKIQITLDGLGEHHNLTRPLKNGNGTFDKIISNLALFADSPIAVVIRMNVDNKNYKDYPKLKKKIDELNNPNIDIYPSPVEDINKDTVNTLSDFMTNDEFESFIMDKCEEGVLSYDDFLVLDDRYCFCTAETENCYVIDELGNFYKCWDEVGREEYICFNINELQNIKYENIYNFVGKDAFENKKCSKCIFFPLCFGGCKFQREYRKEVSCLFSDDSLKQYLETHFFLKHK